MMAAPVRGSAPRARQQHQWTRPCRKALQAHAAAPERQRLRLPGILLLWLLRLRLLLLAACGRGWLGKLQQSDASWHRIALSMWALPAALVAAAARAAACGGKLFGRCSR